MYRRVEVDQTGAIHFAEHESLPLPDGSARIAVAFCSVNRGDVERIRGSYGGFEMSFWRTASGRYVPGYEPAGTVVEVAPDVDPDVVGRRAVIHSHMSCGACSYCVAGIDNLCPEMRVCGVNLFDLGGWTEEIVVPAQLVLPLESGADLAGACTYEVTYGAALHNLRRGLELASLPGPIAVRGVPGALALAAVQFCAAFDLPCIAIARDPHTDRVRQLRGLLPDLQVVGEDLDARQLAATLGEPPAVVIDPLGGPYLAQDVDIVARGGSIGVLGAHVGASSTLRSDRLFLKGVSLYGTPRAPISTMVEVARMVASGVITPLIDRIFDFNNVVPAIEYCEKPSGIGRVLLAIADTQR